MRGITNREVADAIVAGFKASGIPFHSRNVDVSERGQNRMFMIRLSEDGQILPSLGHIESQIKLDRVPPGSVQGAHFCVVGMVQKAHNQVRMTGRIIRTETGVVLETAKADGGADPKGLIDAATRVARALWKAFRNTA
jgi:hypothetical protein